MFSLSRGDSFHTFVKKKGKKEENSVEKRELSAAGFLPYFVKKRKTHGEIPVKCR